VISSSQEKLVSSFSDLTESSYQGYAGFLLLVGLPQEAHSYSTQRFEIIREATKRQVGLVISFRQNSLGQVTYNPYNYNHCKKC